MLKQFELFTLRSNIYAYNILHKNEMKYVTYQRHDCYIWGQVYHIIQQAYTSTYNIYQYKNIYYAMQLILFLEPCSILENLKENTSEYYMLSKTLHKVLSIISKDLKTSTSLWKIPVVAHQISYNPEKVKPKRKGQ